MSEQPSVEKDAPRWMRRPWRRCGSCGGVCHFEATHWVCDDCGDEWDADFDPKYAAPGDSGVTSPGVDQ
jgi:hypothetical protein